MNTKLTKEQIEAKYFHNGKYNSFKSEARKEEIKAEIAKKNTPSSHIVKAMAKIMLIGAALASKETLLPIRGIISHCSEIARS